MRSGKAHPPTYQPTVSVTTEGHADHIDGLEPSRLVGVDVASTWHKRTGVRAP